MKIFTIFTICVFIHFIYFLLFNFIDIMNVKTANYNEKYNDYIKHFPELSNNYTLNATIIRISYVFNIETLDYTGELIMKYDNIIDKHNYCKLNIVAHGIPIKEEYIITNYISHNYKLGNNYTTLYCNHEQCIFRFYYNVDHYDPFYCTILN